MDSVRIVGIDCFFKFVCGWCSGGCVLGIIGLKSGIDNLTYRN